jgi:geranyl-CoA carboxylase beta subunit
VLVRGRSSIYLAGPPLVKAAIGEDATDEELGGAETHAQVTGLGEYLAEHDAHAIALARELLDKLPWDTVAPPSPIAEPLYPADDLMGIVPADEREPYDVREVIARLVDGSDFLEFKTGYAPATHAGTATRWGWSATTGRSSRTAARRRRSSSSCATRAARRSSSCRTPPATWWARRPNTPARSSTAAR